MGRPQQKAAGTCSKSGGHLDGLHDAGKLRPKDLESAFTPALQGYSDRREHRGGQVRVQNLQKVVSFA